MFKILIFAVEFAMICVVTGIMAAVIKTYEIPVPILSLIVPNLKVNDVIGFFLALVVVGVPIFTWKAAFESTLFRDTSNFFNSQNNVIWFAVGVAGLASVFALETYSFYTNAVSELGNVAPCSVGNPFRPPEVCANEIEAIEKKIERAIPYAFLISISNIMIGAGAAFVIHKR